MKKILSFMMAIIMMISVLPMSSITALANTSFTYDGEAAIAFAASHCSADISGGNGIWNCKDGWLCARFVANCLRAGGFPVQLSASAKTFASQIVTYGPKISSSKTGSGKVNISTFNGKLSKGDPIVIIYNNGDGHIVIYSGETASDGTVKVYAHNARVNNGNLVTANAAEIFAVNLTPDKPVQYSEISYGIYYIRNKATQMDITVNNGADAQNQNVLVGAYAGTAAQQIEITSTPNPGGYALRPLCSASRVINSYGDTVSSGNNVCIWDNTTHASQRWAFEKVDGGFIIRNVMNSYVALDIRNEYDLYVNSYNGGDSQIWDLVSYVSFDANGGTGAPEAQAKSYGTDLILSSTEPTKQGYDFVGWSADSSATTATYTAGGAYNVEGCATLYAIYKTHEHIYDNSNDATCNTCGEVRTVVLNGWVEGSDGRFRYYENNVKATSKWVLNSKGYFYVDADGLLCKQMGIQKDGKWFYVGTNGYRFENKFTGWAECADGAWRYFQKDVAAADEWILNSKGYFYVDAEGILCKKMGVKKDGKWFYVGTNGYRFENKFTGWAECSDGAWRYFKKDVAATDEWIKNATGYFYVNGEGKLIKNSWIKSGSDWYFVNGNGYRVLSSWKKDSKGWCYLGYDGKMVTNAWAKDSKGWCFVGADGYAVTNTWKRDSKGWCYLDSNGSQLKKGWVKENGKMYYLNAEGYMLANTSIKLYGKTYYFNASGVCTNP